MVSPIRMGGLVSGLETESIVKNLMKAQSAPLNKLLQKKQTEEWRRDQYREMNALLSDLKNKTFDMKLQSTYQKKELTSNNDSIVSVKQKGSPNASVYNVELQVAPIAAQAETSKFTIKDSLVNGTTLIAEDFAFTIGSDPNKHSIDVTITDTIHSVVAKINALSSQTGVTASFMQDDKSITFTSNGKYPAIDISSEFQSKLGNALVPPQNKPAVAGTAGSALINGISYAIKSNTFTFDGVEFNIKGPGKAQISLKPDEDAVFKSIKEYVDKYNEVIGKINGKLSERTYRDYKPLLNEEKESLSDKQVEQWEQKAKSGLLRQDGLLSNALSELRLSLSTNVSGAGLDSKYDNLSEIGITTGDYSEKGKLYIDEAKLKEAISKNGNGIMELFTKKSTSTDAATKFAESGLIERLYDQLNGTMIKLTEKAGSSGSFTDKSILGQGLTRINTDISRWEKRLEGIESRYWKQFTAMESAMSKANAQGNWLTQQLG
ncbi:flagellar filament capping protein FliD [Paenibacillus sp. FSL K6-3182]|uniref:flagellar filament capping protein FliD n=1 Tax=Paenibacillus sp. FSL K6-3182 TaxID=2921495 RepID=UPI0030D4BFEA